MKKRIALIIAAVLIVLITASCFITVNSEEQITIHANLLNTVHELSTPAEWQKWHPKLTQACTTGKACSVTVDSAARSFSIQSSQNSLQVINKGLTFIVTETAGSKTTAYSYNAIPFIRDDSTGIIVMGEKRLIDVLLPFLSNANETSAVDSLKSFIETPDKYYGFHIEIKPVIDTNVVIISKTTLPQNRAATLAEMRQKIDDYIAINKLTVIQPLMVHYQALSKDSIQMMMGVPINKMSAPLNGVSCEHMPKGRNIIGYYKGSFAGRIALYKALDRFMRDKNFRPVAINYEKYLDNTIPLNDSSQINIELHWPVF